MPDSFFVVLAQLLQLALLGVVRLLEDLLVCVFQILVQLQLVLSQVSNHVQVVSVLLHLLSELALRLLVFSLGLFDALPARVLSLLELIEELLHDR